MNAFERPATETIPQFSMEFFDMGAGFDINAAFQEAVMGVVSDSELALEEKVRRMAVIVSEGTSEAYREFVDFRQMAAQLQMACTHDHALGQSLQGNEVVSGFMDGHKAEADHGHEHAGASSEARHAEDDDDEIDPKTGRKLKKKKQSGLLPLLLK